MGHREEGGGMSPRNVISFSSGKNLKVAEALTAEIRGEECRPGGWKDDFRTVFGAEFEPTKVCSLFPSLSKNLPSFDFAVALEMGFSDAETEFGKSMEVDGEEE